MNKANVTWYLDMHGRVIYVLAANPDIIESVPALDDATKDFKLRVDADNDLAEQLPDEDESNGYADHKNEVWESLARSINSMMGGLRSYAKKQKNTELFAQAKFTPSMLLKKRGSDAINLANSKLNLLNEQVANLANYNVTAAKITAATALSDELAILNPKPLAQRSVDKGLRSQLTKQIRETTILLKDEIDSLVLTLEPDYPGFVEQYFNARRLVKTGIRHKKTEEEIAQLKEAANARKLEKEAEAAAQQPEAGSPTPDGNLADSNGSHPPTESPNNGEPSGEMA